MCPPLPLISLLLSLACARVLLLYLAQVVPLDLCALTPPSYSQASFMPSRSFFPCSFGSFCKSVPAPFYRFHYNFAAEKAAKRPVLRSLLRSARHHFVHAAGAFAPTWLLYCSFTELTSMCEKIIETFVHLVFSLWRHTIKKVIWKSFLKSNKAC